MKRLGKRQDRIDATAVTNEVRDNLRDIAQSEAQLLAANGRIPWAGGDHTTLPAGAGDYLITRGSEAGQVWTRATNGADPTRNDVLESLSMSGLARASLGANATPGDLTAAGKLLSGDHQPRYAFRQRLLELGFPRTGLTGAQFRTAMESAAAAAVAGLLTLNVHAMTVTLDAAITLPPGVRVEFAPGFKCLRDFQGSALRVAPGMSSAVANLTTDIDVLVYPRYTPNTADYTTRLDLPAGSVAALGVQVGDWVALVSDEQIAGAGKYGCMRRVTKITGDGLHTWAPNRRMLTSANARVYRLPMSDGPQIRGGEWTDSAALRAQMAAGSLSTTTPAMFTARFVRDFTVQDAYIHDTCGEAISLNWCLTPRVTGCRIHEAGDTEFNPTGEANQYGYGIDIQGGTLGAIVDGNRISRVRHGVTTTAGYLYPGGTTLPFYGEPELGMISNNLIYDCKNSGIDTHEEGYGLTFVNNTVTGCLGPGISHRATATRNIGNVVSNNLYYGIRVTASANNTLVQGNLVTGTLAKWVGGVYDSAGFGIYSLSGAKGCVIIGNHAATNDIIQIVGSGDSFIRDNFVNGATGIQVSNANNVVTNNHMYFCATGIREAAGSTGTTLRGTTYNNTTTPYDLGGTGRTQTGNQGLGDATPLPAPLSMYAGTRLPTTSNVVLLQSGSGTDVTLTSVPTAYAGTDGQTVTYINRGNAGTITVQDRGALSGGLIKLKTGTTFGLAPQGGVFTMMYVGNLGYWVQV